MSGVLTIELSSGAEAVEILQTDNGATWLRLANPQGGEDLLTLGPIKGMIELVLVENIKPAL